eukprot:g64940.t1
MSSKNEGEPAPKKSKKEKQSGSPAGEGKADSSPLSRGCLLRFCGCLWRFLGLELGFLVCYLIWVVFCAGQGCLRMVCALLLTFC